MSIPEQSGDSFDFCVLFRVYFTGKGAIIVVHAAFRPVDQLLLQLSHSCCKCFRLQGTAAYNRYFHVAIQKVDVMFTVFYHLVYDVNKPLLQFILADRPCHQTR